MTEPHNSLLKLLIVDADAAVVETFARALRLLGHDVSTAVDAEVGLSKVDEFHPDAIILDLRLPGAGGLTFLQRLRGKANHNRTPVAIITGDFGFDKSVLAAIGEFDTELYFKPLRVGELLMITQRLARRSP